MVNPATFTIKVDQNQLRWDRTSINEAFNENEGGEFVSEIVNTGVKDQAFSITNIPSWLEVRPQAGTIKGGQSIEITMDVHPGLNVGYYNQQIYLRGSNDYNDPLFLDVYIQATQPEWATDLGNFQNNMNVIGRLVIDGITSTDENDMIAAYVGNELRGYANVSYQKNYDNYAVYLSVGSNSSEGELVKFKLWDASTGLVYPVDDINFVFETDAIKGSIQDPIIFRSGDLIQRDLQLNEGWNWISVNLRSTDDDVNTVFKQIRANTGDRLVGQNTFYTYDNNNWEGASTDISFVSMYKLFVSNATSLRISGIPVDPITTEIDIEDGWNWIAYTPQYNAEINEAMSLYQASNNDEIKTMNKFARFDVETNKWYGSLTHLSPGVGYQLKSNDETSLIFPETNSFRNVKTTKASGINDTKDEEEETSTILISSNKNMSLVATLQDQFGNAIRSNNITAYTNDKPLSITKAKMTNNSDENLYFITIPEDEEISEINFKYEDENGIKTDIKTVINFGADASIGTINSPEILISEIEKDETNIRIFPNPSSDHLNIEIDLKEDSEVQISIYSTSGKLISSKNLGLTLRGKQQISLDKEIKDLPTGNYLIKTTLDNSSYNSKFIKL